MLEEITSCLNIHLLVALRISLTFSFFIETILSFAQGERGHSLSIEVMFGIRAGNQFFHVYTQVVRYGHVDMAFVVVGPVCAVKETCAVKFNVFAELINGNLLLL